MYKPIALMLALLGAGACQNSIQKYEPASAALRMPELAVTSAPTELGKAKLAATRMPKWRQMYARHQETRNGAIWQRLVAEFQSVPKENLLHNVNRRLNSRSYREDSANWRKDDYWASPTEFLSRGGDCEDFAIAKYFLLNELGVSVKDMQILITKDHAVLVVRESGREFVLDNRSNSVYPLRRPLASKAIFLINGDSWWISRSITRA